MNRVSVIAAVVCIVFVSSLVLIPLANADWAMFHADETHFGERTGTLVLTPTKLWDFYTDDLGSVYSSPAVFGGVVYVGCSNYYVYALDAAKGTEVWKYKTSGYIYSSPACYTADFGNGAKIGVVYLGSNDGNVYALKAGNGEKIWSYHTDGAVESSPVVVDGVVSVGSDDGHLYALDAVKGTKIWSYDCHGGVKSSPAVFGGLVIVGSNDGNVYALKAGNGDAVLKWSYYTGGVISTAPSIYQNGVCVGDSAGNVTDLDTYTGKYGWNYLTGDAVQSSPVASGVFNREYVGSDDGYVYALGIGSGDKYWSYKTDGPVRSSPAVVTTPDLSNGVVYVGSDDGHLYALDAVKGTKIWSYTASKAIVSSPAYDNGVVYVGSLDGDVFALGVPATSSSSGTVSATTDSGTTINLAISGSIASSQMSNVKITTDPSATKTTVSFTVTGTDGTTGYSTVTIPNSAVLPGSKPLIYIDNQPAQSQSFTQDANNYYVSYTTQFSTHEVSIMFSTTQNSTPLPSQNPTTSPEQPSASASPTATTGGSKSPCIIATATYGSAWAPQVVFMRSVRDDLIGSSPTGKVLVNAWNKFYYSWSPPVAYAISDSSALKDTFKVLLAPLLGSMYVVAGTYYTWAWLSPDLAAAIAFLTAALLSIGIYIVIPAFAIKYTVKLVRNSRRKSNEKKNML